MDEYNIWNQIFETDDQKKIRGLINLVIFDQAARDLVSKKITDLKNNMKEIYNININIDGDINEMNMEIFIKKITDQILNNFVK